MDTFKIVKVSKHSKKRKASPEPSTSKNEKGKADTEKPATTLGIPKKKYSKMKIENFVKNSQECEAELPLPEPVYDYEGKDVELHKMHPSDQKLSECMTKSCKYVLKRSYLAHKELERVLNMRTTLGPQGSIAYMTRMIQQDRNLKLSLHYMLLAENARLTEVPPRTVQSSTQEVIPLFKDPEESKSQKDSDSEGW